MYTEHLLSRHEMAYTPIRMSPISDLDILLRSMAPVLNAGSFVYAQAADDCPIDIKQVVAFVREPEGLSLVVSEAYANQLGLQILLRCRWITLTVNSDLQAVGLTAAFATALGDVGISCNVVAGASHDHIFIPEADAERAMDALLKLQRGTPQSAGKRT